MQRGILDAKVRKISIDDSYRKVEQQPPDTVSECSGGYDWAVKCTDKYGPAPFSAVAFAFFSTIIS